MTSRRRRPPLTSSDIALWRRVTEHIRPLKTGKSRKPPAPDPAPGTSPEPEAEKPPPAETKFRPMARHADQAAPPRSLAPLDHRLIRRVGRGQTHVDAMVDLHGLTQQQAHARLLAFLRRAHDRGHRLVLVVTGKGRVDETGDWWTTSARGILRRAVPEWLETPEFRDLVVGYRQAHERKGGAGAIYVQLRRRRPENDRS